MPKSKGTIMAEEARKGTQKLSRAEREKLLGSAMKIIYSGKPKPTKKGK